MALKIPKILLLFCIHWVTANLFIAALCFEKSLSHFKNFFLWLRWFLVCSKGFFAFLRRLSCVQCEQDLWRAFVGHIWTLCQSVFLCVLSSWYLSPRKLKMSLSMYVRNQHRYFVWREQEKLLLYLYLKPRSYAAYSLLQTFCEVR